MTVRGTMVVLFALLLSGCGVPVEQNPRAIGPGPTNSASGSGSAAPADATAGPVEEIMYFVRGGRLVAVHRLADQIPSPGTQLEHLLSGPTDAEHDQGLSSALTGLGITAHVSIGGVTAVVDLGIQPDNAGRSDEVLAYGQIVCTLTGRMDIDLVVFHFEEEPVDVPRGDGSLGRQPLSASDYRSLVAPE